MARRYNARAIKKNHAYTVEEVAETLGVHEQTVRSWGGRGLRVMKSKTPHLILGDDLKQFLGAKERGRKRPLGCDELFCLKCRAARTPEGKLADFVLTGAGRGRLTGICPNCGSMCQRFIRQDQIATKAPSLDVYISARMQRLDEEAEPALKTQQKEVLPPCGNSTRKTNE